MIHVWGDYTDDDGDVRCALFMSVETFALQGFGASFPNTRRKPKGLTPRREVFFNSNGNYTARAYPTIYPPHALGERVTINGDPTWQKVAQTDELNKGESP